MVTGEPHPIADKIGSTLLFNILFNLQLFEKHMLRDKSLIAKQGSTDAQGLYSFELVNKYFK